MAVHKQGVAPRWRGFNLLGMFCSETSAYYKNQLKSFSGTEKRSPGFFKEEDFQIISDWGFDFVRLPLSYRIWSSAKDPFKIDEEKLSPLDDAVYWGQKYGLHVNIALHRGPGYCNNDDEPEREPFDLWKDKEKQDAFVHQWCEIAKRYAYVSPDKLTFNLINEPNGSVGGIDYTRVARKVMDKVRLITPERTFVLDGLSGGAVVPTDSLNGELENVIYSCRGYSPAGLTHHGMRPGREDQFKLKWPGGIALHGEKYLNIDRDSLDRMYNMWAAVGEIYNVGIHCGEFGCANQTPHDITLAWMEDLLSILKEHNIGWAMWNLSGIFGVMDSQRADVEYESFRGHKLDRKMLELLQKY